MIRDIVCFTPLALLLPHFLEQSNAGSGINGILFAAPIADLAAVVVILCLTVSFFRQLEEVEQADMNTPALEKRSADLHKNRSCIQTKGMRIIRTHPLLYSKILSFY